MSNLCQSFVFPYLAIANLLNYSPFLPPALITLPTYRISEPIYWFDIEHRKGCVVICQGLKVPKSLYKYYFIPLD